jgi:hypothetical protein
MGWFTSERDKMEAYAKAEIEKAKAYFVSEKEAAATDFHTRIVALEHAVRHASAVAEVDVVAKAKEFYTFLKGEV